MQNLDAINESLTLITTIVALVFGFLVGKYYRKPKNFLAYADDSKKLDDEVLRDQVKQLEAKVKTLEKALELSQLS